MTVTIIADDLTGACDAGAVFCGRGRVAVFVAPDAPGPAWPVAAVDSESRALSPADAGQRIRDLRARLQPRLAADVVLKKIDSTLRGPIGAELDALLSGGPGAALVCPAFPGQGRVLRDRVLRVDGVPAHESPVGRDPDYPGATSDVLEILRGQSQRPIRHVALDEVRGDGDRLAAALHRADGGIAVADAETDADLRALALAALTRRSLVLAGSAGLATAVSAALGCEGGAVALPVGRAWLVVAGSQHRASRAQVAALAAAGATLRRVDEAGARDLEPLVAALRAGRPAIITTPDTPSPADRRAVAGALAGAAAAVLAETAPTLVCAAGGDTAHALLRALRATHLELAGAPATGLSLGEAVLGGDSGARRLWMLTKAGGFGSPDLLVRLMLDA